MKSIPKELFANFSNGIYQGVEQTVIDIAMWITTWQFWRVQTTQEWLKRFFILAENLVQGFERRVENVYFEKLPKIVQRQICISKFNTFIDATENNLNKLKVTFIVEDQSESEVKKPKGSISMTELPQLNVKLSEDQKSYQLTRTLSNASNGSARSASSGKTTSSVSDDDLEQYGSPYSPNRVFI